MHTVPCALNNAEAEQFLSNIPEKYEKQVKCLKESLSLFQQQMVPGDTVYIHTSVLSALHLPCVWRSCRRESIIPEVCRHTELAVYSYVVFHHIAVYE